MILKKVVHFPVTNSVEATWVDDDDVQVKCHSYAEDQMDQLALDLGPDCSKWADLIAKVRASVKPAPAPTVEQIVAGLEEAVQSELDRRARERNYDGIVSACSYAGAPNPFQAESIAYLSWRASCWAYCYQVLADCQSRPPKRAIPTGPELVAELPALVLP